MRLSLIALLVVLGTGVWAQQPPPSAGSPQEILAAVGGQGMIHRNSWSPDSTRIAFASYEAR